MATSILIMRHAEKSDDPLNRDLTDKGRQRATALATFIPERFGPVHFIFATSDSLHSARPRESVEPLSQATGIAIDARYADQDYGALAHELRSNPAYTDKTIVLCWHHGNIPNLMHSLGARDGEYPYPWGRYVFDLILHTTFDGAAAPTVVAVQEPF
jgi:phosphohistidine phosphatase SixA